MEAQVIKKLLILGTINTAALLLCSLRIRFMIQYQQEIKS
jgi:hypothetical protein